MTILPHTFKTGTPPDAVASTTAAGRLALGFAAGFVSVLIFSNGGIALLQTVGLAPFPPWQMSPTPPFGVPQTVSAAFWGGLWGALYAALEPRLTARLGWWLGGIAFGILPMLAFWLVALPLKGQPISFLLPPIALMISALLHIVFGLGTAMSFRLGWRLGSRNA